MCNLFSLQRSGQRLRLSPAAAYRPHVASAFRLKAAETALKIHAGGMSMTRTKRRGPQTGPEGMADRAAAMVTHWAGSSWGFGMAFAIIIVWALSGPLFRWSDTWQLVINTGTTIVTFLMIFLVQRTQNRDGLAIQLKLNELVAAMQGASNRLIDVETLSEKELQTLHSHYQRLVEMARDDEDMAASHSVDEAEQRHLAKQGTRRSQKGGGEPGGAKKRATSSSA
jgi:low affinity Fe/Cu permease